MSGRMQFFLSIEIKNDNGIDVESFIYNVSCDIEHIAKYKFKVLGEAKIVAILEVDEDDAVRLINMITSSLMQTGPFNVKCTPLTRLDTWEQLLGLGNILNPNAPRRHLCGDSAMWYEFGLDSDMSIDECDKSWREKIVSILEQRRKGQIDMEIFKVLGERRVYVFSCKTVFENWEAHMWKLNMEDKIYKNAKLVTKI